MSLALDYFLKQIYAHGDTGLIGYRSHLQAINAAFDLHSDLLQACVQRAEDTVFNTQPYCWKHVDQAHGVLLESVSANTPLMTHKPILIMHTAHDQPELCFFAQAFYMSMIQWSDAMVDGLVTQFPAPFLKHVEDIETYTTVASLCITWADWILNTRRTEKQWEQRFWLFGLLSTRCLPCAHGCGRVMVMGHEYFDQVDEAVTPNASVTVKAWAHPFGSFDETWETCTAHGILPVTYSHAPIKAGEFIKICMNDPLCLKDHPMQFKDENSHEYAKVLLNVVTMNMKPEDVTEKLTRTTVVLKEHNGVVRSMLLASKEWPSRMTAIIMATASSLVKILQQADLSSPAAVDTIQAITEFIDTMDLPHSSWYYGMIQDLSKPRFKAPQYQAWRDKVKQKLPPDAEDFAAKLLHYF
jgi:hypothetical protein